MRSPLRRRLLFALLPVTLLLLMAQLFGRTWGERLLWRYERQEGGVQLIGSHVGNRPGTVKNGDGPYPWVAFHNAQGLREDAPIPEKKGKGLRFLAVGDSWIYGFSVTQGHTITDVAERQLQERLGEPVEIVNAGVLGASAFDMLLQWRRYGAQLALDGVILGAPHNAATQHAQLAIRSAWYAEHHAAMDAAHQNLLYLLLRRLIGATQVPAYASWIPNKADAQTKAAVEDLLTIVTEAQAHGLSAWFLDFQARMDLSVARSVAPDTLLPDHTWTTAFSALHVPITGHAMRERSCWGFRDLGHPSEAGAAAIGALLADMIAKGEGRPTLSDSPRCADGEGAGPGKEGWPDG